MDIVNKALELGANESEAFFVDKEIITIRMADLQIIEAKGIREQGLALRIVKDKRIGGASTSLINEGQIEKSVRDAISNAEIMNSAQENWRSLPEPANIEKFNGYDKRLEALSIDECADLARRILDSASNFSISNASGSLHVVKENIHLVNSNGIDLHDNGTYIIGNLNADLDSDKVSGVGFNASRSLNSFDPELIGREAASMASRSANPTRCEEDVYSIIFEPYALSDLLAFVFSYNFNAKMYQDKRSALYGMINEKVAVDSFTLIDDPRISDGLGSKAFDDEGVPTKSKRLIDKGVFKSIIYDTFYASKDNVKSTGNALRAGYPVGRSYTSLPFPSLHNIVIEEGEYSNEEMIKDTKKGLLIGRLWYTYAVNPEKGDFSCTARSGIFLIENGEVKRACKMVRIIDNLRRLLLNISAIGRERKQVLQWHAIPCIAPMIRVEGVKAIPV